MLGNIYNYERLEDEVDYLTDISEKEHQKRKNIRYMDVFRSKEIRLAFFVGAGLQVNFETSLNFLFLLCDCVHLKHPFLQKIDRCTLTKKLFVTWGRSCWCRLN